MLVAWARGGTQQCAVSVAPNVLNVKELAALSTTVALFRRLERATAIPSPTRLATVAERTVISLRTSVKGH